MANLIINSSIKNNNKKKSALIYKVFILWAFVLLCKPQYYVPALAPLRPALLSTALMLFFVFIYSKDVKAYKFTEEKQVKLYLFLVTMFILSIPTAIHSRVSFDFVFPDYFISFLFFLVSYKMIDNLDRLKELLLTVCIGSGLYYCMAVSSGGGGSRVRFGTMFDPNDLAYFALVFFPINLLFIKRSNHIVVRLFSLLFFGAGLALILLSGSRGGFVALIVALTLLLFWSRTITKISKIILLSIGILIISFTAIDTERFSTLLNIEDDYNLSSPTGRIEIWKTGIKLMVQNPLTGVGVDNFARALGYDRLESGADVLRWKAAHNVFIQIGTETGFLGLILYFLLSMNALKIFVRGRNQNHDQLLSDICELLVVGYVGMFTAAMFLSQAYSIYWLFYIVLSAVISQMLQQQMKDRVVKGEMVSS